MLRAVPQREVYPIQVLLSVPGGVSPLEAGHRDAALLRQQSLGQHGPHLHPEVDRGDRLDPFREEWLQTGLRRVEDSPQHQVERSLTRLLLNRRKLSGR